MSKSIIKRSNEFSIEEIKILDWELIFNSKYYLEIDIIFNTDLNKIESDFNGTSNESVIIELYESSSFLDSLEFSSRTQTNNDLDEPPTITNYIVDNNKLKVIFDYLNSGFILNTGNLDKNLNIIIHKNNQTEKSFFTSNSNNNDSGIINREIENVSIVSYNLPISNRLEPNNGTHSIITEAIRFNINDNILIYPSGDSSNGLLGNNLKNINHKFNSPSRDSNKGFVYNSHADCDFTHNFSSSLTTNLIYDVNNNSILAKIDKNSASDVLFNPNINEIICPINDDWDNIVLSDSSTTNITRDIYIPVLKGFVSGDSIDVTAEFSNFGTHTSINGVSNTNTINNGEVSFSFSFPQTSTTGSDTGTITITSSNGLNISKSIIITST